MQAKTKFRASDAFALEPFHPVTNAPGEFTQDIRPVADRGVLGSRATDQVNAGGERGRILRTWTPWSFRGNGPRSGDGPATPDNPREQRFPSFGGLVREDDRTNSIFVQHPPTFCECASHHLLKPLAILGPTFDLLGLVLHRLGRLGRERISWIERVTQQRVVGQRALEPDQKEIGKIGVGNGVVVRRIREPGTGGLVGKWVGSRVGMLQ